MLNIQLKKNLLIPFIVALLKGPPSFISNILHQVVICCIMQLYGACSVTPFLGGEIFENRSWRGANNNMMQNVAIKGGGTLRKCYNEKN